MSLDKKQPCLVPLDIVFMELDHIMNLFDALDTIKEPPIKSIPVNIYHSLQ